MQTLDNLLMNKHIDIIDYLERLPNGFISNQQELIDKIKERQQAAQEAQMGAMTQAQPADQPVGV